MRCNLSTSYFAHKGLTPKQIAAETARMGFDGVELGYFLNETDWPEMKQALADNQLSVSSVHAFAPVRIGMPELGPEAFSLATSDENDRKIGILFLRRSLTLAQESGASAIVVHAGRINCDKTFFCRQPLKCRAKRIAAAHQAMCATLDEVIPDFERAGIALALENLPGMTAYPMANEWLDLKAEFPALMAWFDVGHGQLREICELETIQSVLSTQAGSIAGCHIHDVQPPMNDHCAPGTGLVDFDALKPALAKAPIIQVFEPNPHTSSSALETGLAFIKEKWYA